MIANTNEYEKAEEELRDLEAGSHRVELFAGNG
jgi:hypothetical protein